MQGLAWLVLATVAAPPLVVVDRGAVRERSAASPPCVPGIMPMVGAKTRPLRERPQPPTAPRRELPRPLPCFRLVTA